MLTYGIIFWVPITLIYTIAILKYGRKRCYPLFFYLVAAIIGIYINILVDKAFFPIWIDGRVFFESVRNNVDLSLNFMSLSSYQIIGNIIMTIPLGISLVFITDLNNRKRLIVTSFLCFSIEAAQLLLIVMLHRVDSYFDIKDIILNVFGGCVGHFAFLIFSRLLVKFSNPNSDYRDLFSFVSRISYNCVTGRTSLDGIGISGLR